MIGPGTIARLPPLDGGNNNNTGGEVLAPWDPAMMTMNPNNLDATQAAVWRERERRQRTIRLLMMFLLMLLLMDSEEQAGKRRSEPRHRRNQKPDHLSPEVFGARQTQELRLQELTQDHPRYLDLKEKNDGKDVPLDVLKWAQQKAEYVKDEFLVSKETIEEKDPEEDKKVFHYPWNATGFYRGEWVRDEEVDDEAGESIEDEEKATIATSTKAVSGKTTTAPQEDSRSSEHEEIPTQYVDALAIENEMLQLMKERKERVGVILLPPGKEVILRYDHSNFTSIDWKQYGTTKPPKADHYYTRAGTRGASEADSANHNPGYNPDSSNTGEAHFNPSIATSKVTLTKPSGRAAFQLFSRSIPSMKEISLIDGFLKLYDSNMPGYSTHKDILLRVRGVLIHGIGRMSLVSNAGPGRSALVLGHEDNDERDDGIVSQHRHRRLQEALEDLKDSPSHRGVEQIRDEVLSLFGSSPSKKLEENGSENMQWKFESITENEAKRSGKDESSHRVTDDEVVAEGNAEDTAIKTENKASSTGTEALSTSKKRRTKAVDSVAAEPSTDSSQTQVKSTKNAGKQQKQSTSTSASEASPPGQYTWSDVVIPYPFVLDDEDDTIRKTKTPAARKMPPREQLLERNAGICEFEVTMDAKEVEWTVGEWRKLVGRRVKEAINLDPANHPPEPETEDPDEEDGHLEKARRFSSSSSSSKRSESRHSRKPVQDQALIMTMTGAITSPNCDFSASLNVTALRTDWEHTTGKAINYSFYMMLTCLTQIMVLLRQLLHTQAQSAATRVSLLCIGWQTVLDALLCLGHIYLSLAMQPLFTAFASVAFFKLLIFCVIEMKYMALIIQARNSSNGGNTTELLRRQVAMLHLRFYVALFGAFLAFFYAGEKYRIPYNLALYSFWVPQIVQNVITEAKRPMHNYYIYGMSLTRLVAPLYIFAVPNNFLKEVYPESPTDTKMCELLVLWIGIQTAVLIAQGKYGARFMIPARFLPPKFDYSRPIPPSLLPPGTSQEAPPTPDLPLRADRNSSSPSNSESQSLLPDGNPVARDRHATGVTTRNRIKGSRVTRPESTMTTETLTSLEADRNANGQTLDCVICYNPIDVHNRRGYMLAPCDHIFHKDCLVQWMDVKMECPICRTELPSL